MYRPQTTGEVEDEGLFRFTNSDPQQSQDGGAPFTVQEFLFATGAAGDENNLDKIDGVVPLSAASPWKPKALSLGTTGPRA